MSDTIVGRGFSFPLSLNERGQLALTRGRTEIEQSIRLIISTYPGERVMRPTYGCRVHDIVFEPCNMVTALQAERYITEALYAWEPRINVVSVKATPTYEGNNGYLMIGIEYLIKDQSDPQSMVFPFYLLPDSLPES
jgi:hypothetical protein